MNEIELLFLGTGTSAGVPMIGCHCPVCSSPDLKDKRMRPSVIVTYPQPDGIPHRVLIDTTPELRVQCLAHQIDRIDTVVYTHAHADHIMGLDDLRRFNAIKQGPLDVWADGQTHATLRQCFGYAFSKPSPDSMLFRPYLQPREIAGPFAIAGATWTPVPLIHGAVKVLGFRIGRLAYCTDVGEIPETSYALLADLDLLVLDALQPRKHATHFSLEEAVAAARRIGARQTLFTHIAHGMAHEPTNLSLPPDMRLAFDGERATARLGPS